jgi:translocation and assembly module TamA
MRSRTLLLTLVWLLIGTCKTVLAADPQPYKVEIAATGNGELDSTLKATSDLQALRSSAPVGPFGLIARARNDIARLKTAAESFGYYQCQIVIRINGMPLSDPHLADALLALGKGQTAQVAISLTLGPVYTLRRIEIDGEIPAAVAALKVMGIATGQPALAANVLAAGSRLLSALQEQGYAFAKVDAPVAYEAADAPVLDLSFHVDAGAKVNIGEIRIEGLQRIHESLLRKRLLLHTGEQFRPSAIDRARKDLLALNVFAQVSVQIGTGADAEGGVPITFKIRERLRHAVSLNAAFSSDLGGSGGATWTDRDVFGDAEQLSVAASVINLGGSDATGSGYDTSVKYLIPEFGHRDQTLQFAVTALKQSLLTYDQTSRAASVTLARKISSVWSVSAGFSTTDDHIIQGVLYDHNYTLLALPLNVAYDSTDLASPLDDPRRGIRASLSLTPTLAIGHPSSTFLIAQARAAKYFDLARLFGEDPGRTVLALRALAGQALGAGEFSLPPDQRFYGGGSGTIRGYAYQSVGPQFADGNPVGGTSIDAGTVEFRQRFGGSLGAAVFVDAGQVSAASAPFQGSLKIGAGVGLRYYTPIGPIRVDFAVPLVSQPNSGNFQVYIGIGQAF